MKKNKQKTEKRTIEQLIKSERELILATNLQEMYINLLRKDLKNIERDFFKLQLKYQKMRLNK